jgi:hypothetical protein
MPKHNETRGGDGDSTQAYFWPVQVEQNWIANQPKLAN